MNIAGSPGIEQPVQRESRGYFARGFSSGRILLVLVLLGYFAALSARITRVGWVGGWNTFVQHSMYPQFFDLEAVLQGLDRYRAGTPVAEIQQQTGSGAQLLTVAYPALWMWIFTPTGLGQSDSVPAGVILGAVSTAIAVLFLGPLNLAEGLFAALLLISPSFMLGIERGNVDLLVFLIVVLALWMLSLRSRNTTTSAALLILLAAFLKLYPIAAITVFVRKRRGLSIIALAAAVFAVYCALSLDELHRIWGNAGRDTKWSFGCMVGLERIYSWRTHGEAVSRSTIDLLGIAVALAVAAVAGMYTFRRGMEIRLQGGLTGTAFVAGSSIYMFCFLTGNHYSYRLRWLILVVPQLLLWARSCEPARRRARIMAAAVLTAAYATNIGKLFVFSEIANWVLFSLFISLLAGAMLPDIRRALPGSNEWYAAAKRTVAEV